MKAGVISDTHGYFDRHLEELLAGVEVILHAGDVGNQEVLGALEGIAPVRAVRGNVDPVLLDLPHRGTFKLGGIQIELLHQLPASQTELQEWADPKWKEIPRGQDVLLRSFDAGTRVIIFGHTHKPCLTVLSGKLFFNPGSAGKQRFSLPRCCGILELSTNGVGATILSLERYNEKPCWKMWLPAGG